MRAAVRVKHIAISISADRPSAVEWAADIMRMCAFQGIDRVPCEAWNAQSNTGRCSGCKSGVPSIVSCSSMYLTIDSICGSP